MPKYHSRGPEKGSSSTLRRIRRLLRKLIWKNNHIDPPSQKSIQNNSKQQPEIKRRRRKRSFLRSLFGGKRKWQDRLIGLSGKNISEQEQALVEQKQTDLNKHPEHKVDRHRNYPNRNSLKHLFPKHNKSQQDPLDISIVIMPHAQGARSPSSNYKKKKKRSLFKRLFSRKEKPPPKLVLPSDKPKLPVEKEKIIYRDYLPYFVNSIMMFMLAYIVAWLTYQAAVILTASFFHIDSVLYFFEVMFPVGNSSELWSSFNIILITISGPITSLAAGTLYYVYIVRRSKVKGNRLMFFNWLIIHSYCMFFSAFVAGVITGQGFGYVANWMYMNVFFKILFSLIFLFILSWFGFKGSKHILETSNSVFRIKSKNRVVFLFGQVILPWIIGTILLAILKYPGITPQHENILVYDLIIIVSVLFMVVPAFFNKQPNPRLHVERERRQTKISKRNILLALVVVAVFRIGLEPGVHFIIQFAMNIGWYK